jgi:hypothetical protein
VRCQLCCEKAGIMARPVRSKEKEVRRKSERRVPGRQKQ